VRWGELHALTTADIEFDEDGPYIKVRPKLLQATNGEVIGTSRPSMGKGRDASVAPHLADDLDRRCGEVSGPGALLFPLPIDLARPYAPDSFGQSMRSFAPRAGWPVDEHGLLVLTWHSLRHRAATWQLREVGLDPELVSEGLGHGRVSFTRDRHVGTSRDSRQRAANQMARWHAARAS